MLCIYLVKYIPVEYPWNPTWLPEVQQEKKWGKWEYRVALKICKHKEGEKREFIPNYPTPKFPNSIRPVIFPEP